MHVGHPGYHQRHGDEDEDGQEDADVACCRILRRGQEDEAHGRNGTEEADERPSDAHLVRREVGGQDDEEAEEIGRRGQAVGL